MPRGSRSRSPATALPTLAGLGFEPTDLAQLPVPAGMSGARRLFADFQRAHGGLRGGARLPRRQGRVLPLGAQPVRDDLDPRASRARPGRRSGEGPATWLSELVWRDFYFQVLWHHPHAATGAFRREYDAICWPGTDGHFAAWCEARTGFPLVDAAMRQIDATGWMHNRLRMVVASFLVKDLLLDWRRGEKYFADHLLDFDLAANNGGWQWAASTGCDAQP